MTEERPALDISCMSKKGDTEKSVIQRSIAKGTVTNAVTMERFSTIGFADVND